jgi:hypothetical protein
MIVVPSYRGHRIEINAVEAASTPSTRSPTSSASHGYKLTPDLAERCRRRPSPAW